MAAPLVLADLIAHDFDFPDSSYASPDKGYGRETLVFEPNAPNQVAISRSRWMPPGRDTDIDIIVVVCWKAPTYVAGEQVRWRAEFEWYKEGDEEFALTTDHFDSPGKQGAGAIPQAEHTPVYTTLLAFPNGEAAGIQPGEMFRVRITRDTTVGSNYAGNAELLGVLIYELA